VQVDQLDPSLRGWIHRGAGSIEGLGLDPSRGWVLGPSGIEGTGALDPPRGGFLTRPPAQGGSAGAVDTALATPGYGYACSLSKTLCGLHLQLRRVRL
jgi:hypothetical protein